MRVLAIYCHPNPESLVAAACERALSGLRSAGHEVRLTDLYADDFDPATSDGRTRNQGSCRPCSGTPTT